MRKTVIIVAGGKGKRMSSDVPKQFLLIEGLPVLMHTIEAFYRYDETIQIIVVLPESEHSRWQNLCREHKFTVPHEVVGGGQERFHSVKNGLEKATGDIIAVHDGVRPLVSVELIERCFSAAAIHKAIVPVTEIVDSLRILENGKNRILDRNICKIVQTPQVFEARILKKACLQEYNKNFTDDASVVEKSGEKITLVEGERQNIKITTPADLKIAENFLRDLKILNV